MLRFQQEQKLLWFCLKSQLETKFAVTMNILEELLNNWYERDRTSYLEVVNMLYKCLLISESDNSALFQHAIRKKEYELVKTLCQRGVSLSDLEFCASQLLSQLNVDCEEFVQICQNLEIEARKSLRLYAAICTMEHYFRLRSETSLQTFIELFPHHDSDETCPAIGVLFKKAIEKCVEVDSAVCFVRLCMKYCTSEKDTDRRLMYLNTDFQFAFSLAIIQRPHFISKMFEEQVRLKCLPDLAEILLLLVTTVEKEARGLLPAFVSGVVRGSNTLKLMENFAHKLLNDETSWHSLALFLDQWIKEDGKVLKLSNEKSVKDILAHEDLDMPTSLKKWCTDNGYAYFSLFVAMLFKNWTLMKTLFTTFNTNKFCPIHLWEAVTVAAESEAFSACIDIFKSYPIDAEVVESYKIFAGFQKLIENCKKECLFEWAMVLAYYQPEHIKELKKVCPKNVVVPFDWLLKKSVTEERFLEWDVAMEVLTKCSDIEILKLALREAVEHYFGPKNMVEALITRVDPTSCVDFVQYGNDSCHYTLLYLAVILHIEVGVSFQSGLKKVRLLLASGLSTFQRNVPRLGWFDSCPLIAVLSLGTSFNSSDLQFVKLTLECGTYSSETLNEIANDIEFQNCLTSTGTVSEEWKEAYRRVEAAAATPCRLEHLARLAVSHSIGCQPGRADRINKLPLPQLLKDKIMFKTILDDEEEEEDDDEEEEEDDEEDDEEEDVPEKESVEEEDVSEKERDYKEGEFKVEHDEDEED